MGFDYFDRCSGVAEITNIDQSAHKLRGGSEAFGHAIDSSGCFHQAIIRPSWLLKLPVSSIVSAAISGRRALMLASISTMA